MQSQGGLRKPPLFTTNKVSRGGGIPAELFRILKDDAVKVVHSICQQIWKTQQWPQEWKRSVFIPIPKTGNAKECSLVAQMIRNLPAVQETWVQSLGRKDPLQKEMAARSSLLAWEIPCVRSLVDYSPQGCRVGHNLATKTQQIERTEPLGVQDYKQLCGPHRTFLRKMALSLCTLCQLWSS